MKNTLENLILGNWGGITLKAEIEEKMEDIDLAIKYNDHGDQFLVVRSNGEYYEYGYYLNGRWYYDYNTVINNSKNDYGFIRKPKLFCAVDEYSSLANEIYFYVEREFYNTGMFINKTIKKEYSKGYAQLVFDDFIEYMDTVHKKKIIYDIGKYNYRQKVEKYLECNEILTQENIVKLDAVKWDSKVNGIDGITGKRKCGDYIIWDKIEFIYHKGKPVHWRKTKRRYTDDDEWGFRQFTMSLKQFK